MLSKLDKFLQLINKIGSMFNFCIVRTVGNVLIKTLILFP